MSDLVPFSNGLSPRQAIQVGRGRRKAALTLSKHGLKTALAVEIERLDTQAVADVVIAATEEELRVLDFGLSLANGSAAKAELVARKAQLLSDLNNWRIARRFGR